MGLYLALLLAMSGPPAADVKSEHARSIAPFVGDDVVGVIHVDLTKLDVTTLGRRLLGGFASAEEADETTKDVSRWFGALRKAGAKGLYLLANPTDFPGPPVVVVSMAEGADAAEIGLLLRQKAEKPLYAWPAVATVDGAVIGGTPAAIERVRRQKPSSNPDLAAAFDAAGENPIQVVVLLSAEQRRVVEEMMPTLPRELGGDPITIVTRGLRWAAVAMETAPKPLIHVVVQSRDADAAKRLERLIGDSLKLVVKPFGSGSKHPDFARDIAGLKPRVVDDRVVIDADPESASALVGVPLLAVREGARRVQCVNNMKQIALAMHNYLDAHKAFPPAARRDKDGRPLLSWRVLLLPFIEQKPLYDEFHLDEPWDSPHNKALIGRIPPTYICPSARRKLGASGKTTYLVPRGKATMFPDDEAVTIKGITDGTSNTIMVVDADDDHAVIWTKPDDWEVGPDPDFADLVGHHPGGTNFGLADGSVRLLKASIKPKTLRALLTRNGGEVLSSEDY